MIRRIVFLTSFAAFLFAAACGAPQGEEAAQTAEMPDEVTLENGSFDFEVDGRIVHYEIHGQGPVCMALTNSWGFNAGGLRGVLNPLEEILTMVYYDPRGMHMSSDVMEPADMSMAAVREDAHALLQHLGLERAVFVGWSNGASNLLLYAAEYPEDVKAAIVLHGSAYVDIQEFQRMMAEDYPDLMQKSIQLSQELANTDMSPEERNIRLKLFNTMDYMPELFADSENGRELLRTAFADAAFSWEHYTYAMQEFLTFDAREAMGQITAPMLVIAGAHDVAPVEIVKEIADGVEGAQFEVFENSGHFSSLEETDRFLEIVSDFLASIQ